MINLNANFIEKMTHTKHIYTLVHFIVLWSLASCTDFTKENHNKNPHDKLAKISHQVGKTPVFVEEFDQARVKNWVEQLHSFPDNGANMLSENITIQNSILSLDLALIQTLAYPSPIVELGGRFSYLRNTLDTSENRVVR